MTDHTILRIRFKCKLQYVFLQSCGIFRNTCAEKLRPLSSTILMHMDGWGFGLICTSTDRTSWLFTYVP